MTDLPADFKQQVYEIVAAIPAGMVVTYGDIAALCGRPRAARIVGGIAHFGPEDLPWHRVVKAGGRLAEGFPGGVEGHKSMLEAEGIVFDASLVMVDFSKHHFSGGGWHE